VVVVLIAGLDVAHVAGVPRIALVADAHRRSSGIVASAVGAAGRPTPGKADAVVVVVLEVRVGVALGAGLAGIAELAPAQSDAGRVVADTVNAGGHGAAGEAEAVLVVVLIPGLTAAGGRSIAPAMPVVLDLAGSAAAVAVEDVAVVALLSVVDGPVTAKKGVDRDASMVSADLVGEVAVFVAVADIEAVRAVADATLGAVARVVARWALHWMRGRGPAATDESGQERDLGQARSNHR
jgi:hypothetical protein